VGRDVPVTGLEAFAQKQLDHVAVAVVEHLLEELGRTVEEVGEVARLDHGVEFLVGEF
jgi:hypothetical protein